MFWERGLRNEKRDCAMLYGHETLYGTQCGDLERGCSFALVLLFRSLAICFLFCLPSLARAIVHLDLPSRFLEA